MFHSAGQYEGIAYTIVQLIHLSAWGVIAASQPFASRIVPAFAREKAEWLAAAMQETANLSWGSNDDTGRIAASRLWRDRLARVQAAFALQPNHSNEGW